MNDGYRISGKKINLNLALADLRKEVSAYDLILALGILTASGQINSENLEKYIIMGELSLDGSLQPIKGTLPIVIKAKEEGNTKDAAIVGDLNKNISEVIEFFDKATINYDLSNSFLILKNPKIGIKSIV